MLKSALFVDFDNIHLGLMKIGGPNAARLFASDPLTWLSWMEKGMPTDDGADAGKVRRFLVRRCYLDSGRVQRTYREDFTRAGFTIVDCPKVTCTGKNSADIYMVVDLLEHLDHKTEFDEFVILSGDSDFIPALNRIRARDRRTTILSIQHAAEAYLAAADNVVNENDFIQYGLRTSLRPQGKPAPVPAQAARPKLGTVLAPEQVPASPVVPATATTGAPLDELVANAVLEMVKSSPIPVKLADAGSSIRRTFGTALITESKWAGQRTLKKLLKSRHIEAMGFQMDDIHIYDSRRHPMPPSPLPSATKPVDAAPAPAEHDRADDAPAAAVLPDALTEPENAGMPEELTTFALHINAVTGAPLLSTDRYTRVFANLARYLKDNEFNFTLAVERVHNLCLPDDPGISELAISSIIEPMLRAGHQFASADTASRLASTFRQNIATLYRDSQQELSEYEEVLLDEWLVSGCRDGVAA